MMNYLGLREAVSALTGHMLAAMFPNCFGAEPPAGDWEEKVRLERALGRTELLRAMSYVSGGPAQSVAWADAFEAQLETIGELIRTDVQAAYEGDPAARSREEVILAYPAFVAISTYRLAHALYELQVPIVPRMMTEQAHSATGIDIHPGAKIGPYFFIDHGTGVVIGETTTIGERVKLYQHVTLGAKSFAVAEDGTLVKGGKRHPDIGSNVVIYAGATILGGSVHIGDGAVIGGNTWVTTSVPAGETVTLGGQRRKKA
jgi:serine O-acetyltransferase